MIRSCVVKKVTASHHGSSSTEINATTIMRPATGVKKATASHDIVLGGSSSTEINASFSMMPRTVAKKATASHNEKDCVPDGSCVIKCSCIGKGISEHSTSVLQWNQK